MTYEIDRSQYSAHTVTNTETGVTLTQWDVVTIGKSKNEWDVSEIQNHGWVELHRQAMGRVMYRRYSMDRLSKVGSAHDDVETPEAVEAPTAPEVAPGIARVADAMKDEITALIADGTVPADVPDFSSLHDYVDANMLAHEVYGSEIPEDETDEQGEVRNEREGDIFNRASSVVDAWLRAGRPGTYKLVGENTLTGNRWDCETGLTKAQAEDYRRGYKRLESDYKIEYRVEPEA
jgi:hypothetical protein